MGFMGPQVGGKKRGVKRNLQRSYGDALGGGDIPPHPDVASLTLSITSSLTATLSWCRLSSSLSAPRMASWLPLARSCPSCSASLVAHRDSSCLMMSWYTVSRWPCSCDWMSLSTAASIDPDTCQVPDTKVRRQRGSRGQIRGVRDT